MSSASITAYSFVSSLPKDVSGQKFIAWVSSDGSVSPFTLPKGIGASAAPNGYLFSHLGIGTQTGLSPVGVNDVGVSLMGIYLRDHAASPASNGQAQFLKSSHKGELLTTGACKIPIVDVTSANVYTVGSGILYGGYISGNDVNLGDAVRIESGTNIRFNIIFSATSQMHTLDIPTGGIYFSSSIIHTRTIGANGATSVTLFVERP